MRLIERYHIMWQGMLCLKNDSATVQLHFISGSRTMAEHSLPDQPTIESPSGVSLPQLRIIQRMRLEQPQVSIPCLRYSYNSNIGRNCSTKDA